MEPATRLCRAVLQLAGRVPASAGTAVGARTASGMGPGEVIGILERWVVLVLLFGQAYAALGFIVTAKTLARHKQMEEREFAEYFLIGTLTSVLSAMAIAAGLRWFLGA
jgi:predicted permease